jgi:hypothetical protein
MQSGAPSGHVTVRELILPAVRAFVQRHEERLAPQVRHEVRCKLRPVARQRGEGGKKDLQRE